MINLSTIGGILYGFSVFETGLQIIYFGKLPYWLIPHSYTQISGFKIFIVIFGVLLAITGISILINKLTKPFSIISGTILLLIFCFLYIPFQFSSATRYLHLAEWENALKELAFASGIFVLFYQYGESAGNKFFGFFEKLSAIGYILFSVPILCFGLVHFLHAKDVADYVPSWVPYRLFWAYFAGTALLGSGLAIILKIKIRLIAALLGAMLFTWFIILHIPRVIASPVAYLGSEVTSAFLALAYSGIAFVIAGTSKKTV
jgi:hypothetical protein